jgi:hypothetical protein
MTDELAQILFALGALLLVGHGLRQRNIPMANYVKLAAIWVAIFAAVFICVRWLQGE